MCQSSTTDVRCHYVQLSEKTKSILINAELRSIVVFHGRYFFRHLGICNPICVKLLQFMSRIILSNLKNTTSLSQTVFLSSTNAAYTHRQTHTHHDNIRRNAMRWISPNNNNNQNYKNNNNDCNRNSWRMEQPSKRIHQRTWKTYHHCHRGNKRDKLYLSASLSGNSESEHAVFHWVFHHRHGLNNKNNSSNNSDDNNNINNQRQCP